MNPPCQPRMPATYNETQPNLQQMMDPAHCKLLYDENEDLHGYQTFYDFSSSYLNAEKEGLVAGTGDAAGAVGANVETNEAGGESDDDDVEVTRTLGVEDLGELVLLDKKTVGNRKWSRYYKQRLRTPDEREAVVVRRRVTRLQLGAMYDGEMRKGTPMGNAVALQCGQRKAFGRLPRVSCPKDVKILRAHQQNQARQRLKTETRQNKLNKTFERVVDM